MKRDQWIGAGLMFGSLFVGMGLTLALYRAEAGIRLEMYVIPALLFFVGFLMLVTDFESAPIVEGLSEMVENLPEAVADEVQDIKAKRFTFTMAQILVALGGIVLETWLIFHYRKWNAEWGQISVLLIATIVAVATAYLCFRSEWFQNRWERLSAKIFIIPLVGFCLCALLGAYYAEPQGYGEMSLMERDQLARSDAYAESTRGNQIVYFFQGITRSSSSSADVDIDCDGDGCIALGLLILVVVMVTASATILHFWLVGTSILLTVMIMVAVRELIYFEKHRRYSY